MDFNETYFRLYLSEDLENEDIDNSNSNHENRNIHIRKNYLVQKEAERIRSEVAKKTEQIKKEVKRRSKFRTILNALSIK